MYLTIGPFKNTGTGRELVYMYPPKHNYETVKNTQEIAGNGEIDPLSVLNRVRKIYDFLFKEPYMKILGK